MLEAQNGREHVGVVVGVAQQLGGAIGLHLVEGVRDAHGGVVGRALEGVEEVADGVAAGSVGRCVIFVADGEFCIGVYPEPKNILFSRVVELDRRADVPHPRAVTTGSVVVPFMLVLVHLQEDETAALLRANDEIDVAKLLLTRLKLARQRAAVVKVDLASKLSGAGRAATVEGLRVASDHKPLEHLDLLLLGNLDLLGGRQGGVLAGSGGGLGVLLGDLVVLAVGTEATPTLRAVALGVDQSSAAGAVVHHLFCLLVAFAALSPKALVRAAAVVGEAANRLAVLGRHRPVGTPAMLARGDPQDASRTSAHSHGEVGLVAVFLVRPPVDCVDVSLGGVVWAVRDAVKLGIGLLPRGHLRPELVVYPLLERLECLDALVELALGEVWRFDELPPTTRRALQLVLVLSAPLAALLLPFNPRVARLGALLLPPVNQRVCGAHRAVLRECV